MSDGLHYNLKVEEIGIQLTVLRLLAAKSSFAEL
jgi:hypothetical protein